MNAFTNTWAKVGVATRKSLGAHFATPLSKFLNPPLKQCSHQNLQAEGHKKYLMTTPIILNVVIVSTKRLLHVYYCQQSILVQFNVH